MTNSDGLEEKPSTDTIKIAVATVAIILFSFVAFAVGSSLVFLLILPILLAAGVAVSLKTGGIFYVRVSTRIVQHSALVVVLIAIFMTEVHSTEIGDEFYPIAYIIYALAISTWLAGSILLDFLWLKPFYRKLHDYRQLLARTSILKERRELKVISRESLISYSTADEMKKWSELRECGAISEEEFEKVRAKLLGNPVL